MERMTCETAGDDYGLDLGQTLAVVDRDLMDRQRPGWRMRWLALLAAPLVAVRMAGELVDWNLLA
jgi:hypothetical protein